MVRCAWTPSGERVFERNYGVNAPTNDGDDGPVGRYGRVDVGNAMAKVKTPMPGSR
jgi:hypothetical protein